jgi:cyclic pyranopterin phosphate synthase
MPEDPTWLSQDEILTYEEMFRVISLAVSMGVQSVRLSGGEPLMRRDLEELVRMIRRIPGLRFIGMTTNGFMLPEKAAALKEAGLDGVTISLHSLNPERFSDVTGGGKLDGALAGIAAAQEYQFDPIKINAVTMRGFNDDEILDLASIAFSNRLTVRFIEFMPFDGQQTWQRDRVVSGDEIISKIRKKYRLIPLPRERSSTAKVYRFLDGQGEIGIITSVTEPFCSDCNRIRLAANGKMYTCLFDRSSYDLKPLLRGDASDQELCGFMRDAVARKPPGVQDMLKHFQTLQHVRPMYTIGG